MRPIFIFLFAALLLHTQCASWKQGKWLNAHRKNLTRIANSNMPAEQKLDGLLADYVQFMQEDLRFVNPVKSVKYVQRYHDENEAAMEKILRESEQWQGKLDLVGKVDLGVRTLKKPYVNDLVDLVPKFKKKYKQYAFVLKLTSKLTGGLTRFLGKNLFD
jgi:hypothetical protein